MKSKAYWSNRAIERQSTIDKLSQAELEEIQKIYDAADRDLRKMVSEIYTTYSKKTGIDVSELKKLLSYSETDKFWKTLDGQNMKQYVMNNYKSRITRLEQIQAQLQQKCNEIAGKQERIMTIAGENAIRSSFSKTVYDTSIGVGADLSFAQLDERSINMILKEKWLGSNYSERVWKNTDLLAKNLQSTLTRSMMTGASQSKAIAEIRDRMGVEWYKAERLVRTEMNHFHNQAELEAYEEMGVEKYVYVATLDNRTSEICQELDGKIFKLSEAQEGVNYPPMHPFCRSTVRAYISEEVEKDLKRRARDEEGDNSVIDYMTYSDWMNRNNQQADPLEKNYGGGNTGVVAFKDIQKNDKKVLKEYKKVFKGYEPAPLVEGEYSHASFFLEAGGNNYLIKREVVNTAIPSGLDHVNIGNDALANAYHERAHDLVHQLILKRMGYSEGQMVSSAIIQEIQAKTVIFDSDAYEAVFPNNTYKGEKVEDWSLFNKIISEKISSDCAKLDEHLSEALVQVFGSDNPSEEAILMYNYFVDEWRKTYGE